MMDKFAGHLEICLVNKDASLIYQFAKFNYRVHIMLVYTCSETQNLMRIVPYVIVKIARDSLGILKSNKHFMRHIFDDR